jgi:RNA polymerase sigma-70 factor (ECF subfamily)
MEIVDAPQGLEHYADDLRRLASRRLSPHLRGRLDPSDLVQQTLLVGHERLAQFRGATHAELRGWLRAILDRMLMLAGRRFNRLPPERAVSLEWSMGQSSARLADWLAGDDSTPSHRAARGEQLLRLAEAIAALPVDQRTALELHHFHDLPVAAVAIRMDRTVASVTGLLYRGGKSLRQILD